MAQNGHTHPLAEHDLQHGVNLTKTIHKGPYPSISPLRPELNQAGKTILIAGGSSGIGFAIARAFGQASASRIIILGRRPGPLREARVKLMTELKAAGSKIIVDARGCDIVDLDESRQLWEGFKRERIEIDVLVMNAAALGADTVILESGVEDVWTDYVTNVRTLLDFASFFSKQGLSKSKYLVNVSSSAAHRWFDHAQDRPSYGLTKNSGALLLQQIAKDTKVEDMQIINFHPGSILTQSARNKGYTEDNWAWDHEDMPGHFAVWAASAEASFLHGRFVWARWDVDELRSGELRERLDNDPYFLKIGVIGATGN